MNERILELWEQTTQDKTLQDSHHLIQKFAELIILESIEVLKKNDYHGEWLGEKLLEHFSV